jgi:hypothetical protein
VTRSILNVARVGRSSSDRSIREYVEKIWKVRPCPGGKNMKGRPFLILFRNKFDLSALQSIFLRLDLWQAAH